MDYTLHTHIPNCVINWPRIPFGVWRHISVERCVYTQHSLGGNTKLMGDTKVKPPKRQKKNTSFCHYASRIVHDCTIFYPFLWGLMMTSLEGLHQTHQLAMAQGEHPRSMQRAATRADLVESFFQQRLKRDTWEKP